MKDNVKAINNHDKVMKDDDKGINNNENKNELPKRLTSKQVCY